MVQVEVEAGVTVKKATRIESGTTRQVAQVRAETAAKPDLEAAVVIKENWVGRAACFGIDPEVFFPVGNTVDVAKPAKRICKKCLVRVECLDFAIRNDEKFGVWGGLTVRERGTYKRRAS